MSAERVLRDYFRAKDENRPHLLDGVFARDACLQICNRSSDIQFPAATDGLEAIADILVRRFNQTYENIYSFFMARPDAAAEAFSCDWLVGMSEKDSKNTRVGCGRYDWTFRSTPVFVATHLIITIDQMLVLPPAAASAVMKWLVGLNYPWTSAAAVTAAPPFDALEPVLEYLARDTALN